MAASTERPDDFNVEVPDCKTELRQWPKNPRSGVPRRFERCSRVGLAGWGGRTRTSTQTVIERGSVARRSRKTIHLRDRSTTLVHVQHAHFHGQSLAGSCASAFHRRGSRPRSQPRERRPVTFGPIMLLTSERARSGADADQSQENSMAKQQRRQISPQDDTEQQVDTVYKIV